MTGDREPEAVPGASPEPVAERVCVVIWDGSVPEAELRRQLDDVLPLRFVRWQDRTYLAIVDQLRPRVIVVVEPDDELAADAAGLLACLITAYTPTIIGMTCTPLSAHFEGSDTFIPYVRLLVRQLGTRESAQIESLEDLTLA